MLVFCESPSDHSDHLQKARYEHRLKLTLQQLVYQRLLILDELGYLPFAQ